MDRICVDPKTGILVRILIEINADRKHFSLRENKIEVATKYEPTL